MIERVSALLVGSSYRGDGIIIAPLGAIVVASSRIVEALLRCPEGA